MSEKSTTKPEKRAIILLSGGLDSTTVIHIAQDQGFTPLALSFNYGQRHFIELEAAAKIVESVPGAGHMVVRVDSGLFQGTALVGKEIEVPTEREIDDSIPVTYVPARNILFLSHALALAESLEIRDIFLGVNALDYSGYPDCRPDFIEAFEKMANLGMKAGVEGKPLQIHTPLIKMTKADIIREGMHLGVDYSLTCSCYNPGPKGEPCKKCDSCVLRAKGFADAGFADPLF